MLNLSDPRFRKMRYDVHKADRDVISTYPIFSKYKEFSVSFFTDTNSVLRFIILLYSQDSPLWDIANVTERRQEAASLSLLSIKNPRVKEVLAYKDQKVNAAVIAYLRIIKNNKFAKLAVYTDTYWRKLSELHSGAADEKDKETIITLDKLEDSIDKLTNDILNGELNAGMREALSVSVEDECLALRPEDFALAAQEGKDLLKKFNPYGDKDKETKAESSIGSGSEPGVLPV